MREFYVFGFKSRDEFDKKSARSYDNERRRIESYLADYMSFRQTTSGKNVFISIDSRRIAHNPLYNALKAKSFTDRDITLHFIILDILFSPETSATLKQITEKVQTQYLSFCIEPLYFDESTIRNKLNEYIRLGIIRAEKTGKSVYYARNVQCDLSGWHDTIEFFSETALEGVVGSFILDSIKNVESSFLFKHHYIAQALESEVLFQILKGIEGGKTLHIKTVSFGSKYVNDVDVVPLKIFVSTQSGRQYLLGYNLQQKLIRPFRLDYITNVQEREKFDAFDDKRKQLKDMQQYMWGVSCPTKNRRIEHVEFTIHILAGEEYVYQRLEREKRCGTVERTGALACRFSADVYDVNEMIPWIRTFIGRISSFRCSNRSVERRFQLDIDKMYQLYGIGGADK
jgi:uncharacterized protein YbaR (Trm112 family)